MRIWLASVACLLACSSGSSGNGSTGTPDGSAPPGTPGSPATLGPGEISIDQKDKVYDAFIGADDRVTIFGYTGAGFYPTVKESGKPFILRVDADGHPDASFGNAGVTLLDYEWSYDAAALAPDGGVFVRIGPKGSSRDPWSIVHVLPNGTVDASFGSGGRVALERADLLAVAADGKLLLTTPEGVLRLDTSGVPDPTHGTNGLVELETFNAVDILPSPDGGYVVGSSFIHFLLARLDNTGKLDPTFGEAGLVKPDAFTPSANDVTRSGDSFIVNEGAMWRFRADGTRDPSFGPGGKVESSNGSFTNVLPLKDGRLLARESKDARSVLVRIFVDGTIDTSFAPIPLEPESEPEGRLHYAMKLLLTADERTVIAVGSVEDTKGNEEDQNEDVWVTRIALP